MISFLWFFIDWSFIIDQSVAARRHTREQTEEKADEDRQETVDAKEKIDQEKEDQEEARQKRVNEDEEKKGENVTAVEKGERKDERKEEKKDDKSELTAAEIKKAFDEAEDEEDVEVI